MIKMAFYCHPDRKHYAFGLCLQCYKEMHKEDIQKTQREYYHKNKPARSAQTKRRAYTLKMQVFSHYSPNGVIKCACPRCDVTLLEFLTIDHIEGGGRKFKLSGRALYGWIIKNNFPPGFQVLCYNCNCGRGRHGRNGICPHFQDVIITPNLPL